MVLASFQVDDKLGKSRFFRKTFLVTNTSVEMILSVLFLTLSNADILFIKQKLTWRSYIPAKILPTTKQIQIIDRKKFAVAALDPGKEVFVIHIASLSLEAKILIYLTREAQVALLVAKKVNIPAKYQDYSDIFSKKLVTELSKCSDINKYIINLKPGKQLSYGPIYSLKPVKLETLKTYIKTNLANGFIWPSKFSA